MQENPSPEAPSYNQPRSTPHNDYLIPQIVIQLPKPRIHARTQQTHPVTATVTTSDIATGLRGKTLRTPLADGATQFSGDSGNSKRTSLQLEKEVVLEWVCRKFKKTNLLGLHWQERLASKSKALIRSAFCRLKELFLLKGSCRISHSSVNCNLQLHPLRIEIAILANRLERVFLKKAWNRLYQLAKCSKFSRFAHMPFGDPTPTTTRVYPNILKSPRNQPSPNRNSLDYSPRFQPPIQPSITHLIFQTNDYSLSPLVPSAPKSPSCASVPEGENLHHPLSWRGEKKLMHSQHMPRIQEVKLALLPISNKKREIKFIAPPNVNSLTTKRRPAYAAPNIAIACSTVSNSKIPIASAQAKHYRRPLSLSACPIPTLKHSIQISRQPQSWLSDQKERTNNSYEAQVVKARGEVRLVSPPPRVIGMADDEYRMARVVPEENRSMRLEISRNVCPPRVMPH